MAKIDASATYRYSWQYGYETDKRAVRDDPDLKGGSYLGEFVIAEAKIYHIATSGHVSDVGERQNLLF